MKHLATPEPCKTLVERGHVTLVTWRDRKWLVVKTLDVWVYRVDWWLTASLEGERRVYHLLATRKGEIEVFERTRDRVRAWLVSGWWD